MDLRRRDSGSSGEEEGPDPGDVESGAEARGCDRAGGVGAASSDGLPAAALGGVEALKGQSVVAKAAHLASDPGDLLEALLRDRAGSSVDLAGRRLSIVSRGARDVGWGAHILLSPAGVGFGSLGVGHACVADPAVFIAKVALGGTSAGAAHELGVFGELAV